MAQELNLFERTETEPEAVQTAQPARVLNQNGKPAFTLRSTSRFGDEYQVVLLDRNGSPMKVNWHEGTSTKVPGAQGFEVVDVNPRLVSLVHPNEDACIADASKGVTCADGNIAILNLSNAAPIQAGADGPANETAGASLEAASTDAGTNGTEPAEPQVFLNPFSGQPEVLREIPEEERLARLQRQRERAARLDQFQPVRIDEADVPPGMRIDRTPFGDRLVPIRE